MVPRNESQSQPQSRPPPAPRLWSRLSTFSKKSLRSFSSSFEADDERSSSDDDRYDYFYGTMSRRNGDDDDGSPPSSRYQGEDSRPTSRKELAGWYAYAFAAETYVICAIGSFIPILLETLARENGVLLSDRKTPCGTSDSKSKADGQCIVIVAGLEINTASFAMYTFSISVLLQALLVVSISCAADHGNYRKKLLLSFGWVGSFCVMAYIFVTKDTYLFGALLAIISNTSFGASFVLLNSFLPLLVRHHPETIGNARTPDLVPTHLESAPLSESAADSDSAVADMEESTSALLGGEEGYRPRGRTFKASQEEKISQELNLSTQISAKGIGIGYIAGLFLQCIAIGILIAMKNSTWAQRVVLFVVGSWWATFTIPAAMWLRPRPGPPLPIVASSGFSGPWSWVGYVLYAWKSLYKTVKLARRLLDIMLFLAAWFLLSDAIATTSSTAILFAKTQLHMKPWALGMINVISTTAGVIGAFSWAFVSRRFGLRPHQTILVCIGLFELIPLYGLLGYLPFVRSWGVLGLQQPWEMYPLAAVYGFVLGGLSGYCRSVYGELIPPGSEAAFYALYAITDKGSSIFGPAIVGAIIDRSGHIRPAFWFLAALVGLPAPLIYSIDVQRGKREGEKLARTIEGFQDDEAALRSDDDGDTESEDRPILSAYDDEDEERARRR